MLNSLLSLVPTETRAATATDRHDRRGGATFGATFDQVTRRNQSGPSDRPFVPSGRELPDSASAAASSAPGQSAVEADSRRESARTGPEAHIVRNTAQNGNERPNSPSSSPQRVNLPEPAGEQVQLPVSQEVADWLSGDGGAEAIDKDDLLGQLLLADPEIKSSLEQQAAALGDLSPGQHSVLVSVDSLPGSVLAAIDGLAALDPSELGSWLNSMQIMTNGRPHAGEAKGAGIPAPTPMGSGADDGGDVMLAPTSQNRSVDSDGKPTAYRLSERLATLTEAIRGDAEPTELSGRGLNQTDATVARDSVLQRLSLTEQIRQHIERPLAANQGAAELTRQMGERVVMMIGQNLQEARMRLDPPDLGPMEIRIQTGQDQVQVQLSSQQPMVRDLLEQQAGRLRDLLSQQGFAEVDVDVSDQGSWGQADGEESDEGGSGGSGKGSEEGEDGTPDALSQGETVLGLVDHYV